MALDLVHTYDILFHHCRLTTTGQLDILTSIVAATSFGLLRQLLVDHTLLIGKSADLFVSSQGFWFGFAPKPLNGRSTLEDTYCVYLITFEPKATA